MNILIIGDSWGVPNYVDPKGAKPEEHLEYRLKCLGYSVHNHAINGSSNQRSMESVNFSVLPTIDWIIWFHTEVFRYNFDIKKTIKENLFIESHKAYSYAKDFFLNTSSKLVVIGGQAPIGPTIRETFFNYIKPDYIIEDWRSELLGEELPECYTVSSNNGIVWASNNADTQEEKEKLINNQIYIINKMWESEYFPDNCHPGAKAHEILTNKLHSIFINKPL